MSAFDILFETLAEMNRPVKWDDMVRDEKPLSGLCQPAKPYVKLEIKHVHGQKWDNCEWCDQEINESNEGKWLKLKHRDWCKEAKHLQFSTEIEIHHVCNNCLEKTEDKEDVDNYPSYLKLYFDILEIKTY